MRYFALALILTLVAGCSGRCGRPHPGDGASYPVVDRWWK